MKIYVGRKDIINGIRTSCSKCPIALAVMRALKLNTNEFAISVGGGYILIGKRPLWKGSPDLQYDPFGDENAFRIKYRRNGKIAKFINAFDNVSDTAKLNPMTFFIPNKLIRNKRDVLGVVI